MRENEFVKYKKGGSEMKKWSLLLIIAAVALLIPMLSANVSAEEDTSQGASISIDKSADKNSAQLGDTITYTFTIANSGNVTISNLSLEDDMLGEINLDEVTSLSPGENIAATATYTVTIADLPGPIINTANVTGMYADGRSILAVSDQVSVSLTIDKTLLTKAEILKLSGVPGKGIDTAPGLQKPFNPKSQAAEHAGKKDRDNEEEQLQIRQRMENHSDADGQLKIRQKTKHHHKK